MIYSELWSNQNIFLYGPTADLILTNCKSTFWTPPKLGVAPVSISITSSSGGRDVRSDLPVNVGRPLTRRQPLAGLVESEAVQLDADLQLLHVIAGGVWSRGSRKYERVGL